MKDETKNEMQETNEQIKPIVLEDEKGNIYTLEYSREAVIFAENRKFLIDDVVKYPVSKIPELFFYAFYMHHKGITRQTTDELLKNIGEIPDGFLERLIQLYHVPANTLFGGNGKNGKVVVSL